MRLRTGKLSTLFTFGNSTTGRSSTLSSLLPAGRKYHARNRPPTMPNESTVRVADWLADDWRDLQHDPTFIAEELILDVAVQIAEAMEEAGFETQEELANELDVSKSAVSQLLSGDQNISLKRLVTVALALDKSVEVALVDRDRPDVESVPTKTKRLALDGGTTQRSDDQMAAWSSQAGRRTHPDTTVNVDLGPVPASGVDDDPAA